MKRRTMNKGILVGEIITKTTRRKTIGRYMPRRKICSQYSQRRLYNKG